MTSKRLERHLLRRMRRRAIRVAFEAAHLVGILNRERREVEGINLSRYTLGPRSVRLSGNAGQDEALLLRRLSREGLRPTLPPVVTEDSIEAEVIREMIEDGASVDSAERFVRDRVGATSEGARNEALKVSSTGDDLNHLIRLIGRAARYPSVAETAVCLSLLEAVRRSCPTLTSIAKTLAGPAPIICVRAPVRGCERIIGLMLEHGILGQPLVLRDGCGGYSLSRRIHSDQSHYVRRTATTFWLSDLDNAGLDKTRLLLARAEAAAKPILIFTEGQLPWPRRISSSADLILEAPALDWPLLAELIEICTAIPADDVTAAQSDYRIDPWRFGLDDLSLAIRPDRELSDILRRLEGFSRDDAIISGDEKESSPSKEDLHEKKESRGGASSPSGSSQTSRNDKKLSIDIIQPVQRRKETGGKSNDPEILLVERLAGYGEAREWAMDLKADIGLWRRKKLGWSDMNTKLLLSGPPGTGKTTFARALCNTLGIPLIVTSVGQWLEPGNLGDVLKRISGVFEAAQSHKPVILFVDEIDGIGRREGGAGRSYDDYWVSVVNRVLELLDGALRSEGVVIVGATNRPEVMDPALLRSGRLEKHIIIPPPDLNALEGIFRHHLGRDLAAILTGTPASALPGAPEGDDAVKEVKEASSSSRQLPAKLRSSTTAAAAIGKARAEINEGQS